MFTTFTVQPLLRGVHLDDASAAVEASFSTGSKSFLDRPSGALTGVTSPGSKSTSIFNRNAKPVVEALDNFENHLYLGTSDGYILHYVIEEQISSESELPRSRLVQRRSLGFGKKVVERIMVISKLRIAIVHCDSTLSFYSLPDFTPFSPQMLPPIKGVTAFCDDGSQRGQVAEDGSVRLCVAKRRIILFYSLWHDAISEPRELTLPNGALVVTRWKNFVCFADANDFNLIDCRVGRMIPVLPVVQSTSSGSSAQVLKPACIAIAENEFLLASATSSGQTAIGIFCSGAGDPVRGTLQWSSYPRALGVEFPYVAALLRNNIVEIHNILDQKLIQTIRFDPSTEARTIVQGPGLAVWMSTLANVLTLQSNDQSPQMEAQRSEMERRQQEANRISTVLARVLVAGKDSVSALVTTPLVLHADILLQKGRVEEALLLSEKTMATMSAENLHRERLQHELDYIYQKSGLIYLGETLFDDAFALFKRGNISPQVLISLFPDVLQQSDLMRHVKLYRGIREHLYYLRSLPDIINRTFSKSGGEQDAEFGKVLLMNAKEVFAKYLQGYRKEFSNRKSRPGPESVATDTALLGLWVDSNDDANLNQLLESSNSCAEDLCEQKLKASNKHYALSLWYKAHKDYSATLSIWKRLLKHEIEDSASDIGLQGMASLLLSLQDPTLVEDYGWWLVEQDEAVGLKIFMPGDAKRAAMFDADQILARCKSTISRAGLMSYLEYIVVQRKSESPDHHRMLCSLYVESISLSIADSNVVTKHQEIVAQFTKHQESRLLEPGAASAPTPSTAGSSGTFMTFLQSHTKTDTICHYRVKLSVFLQSSSFYDASEALSMVEQIPLLFFERAILLAKISKFQECIGVMVKDIKDYQGAEVFCLNAGAFKVHKKGAKAVVNDGSQPKESIAEMNARKKLFMILLQEYLHMAQDQGGMVLTLRLLNSQSSYLDISEVIHLLPAFWSVELLQQYLLRSLRRNYHDFKEIQVVKGLSLGENLRISEELFQLYESEGPVVITADVECDVCGIAVADAVFMRTVDNRIIHLHCGSSSSS